MGRTFVNERAKDEVIPPRQFFAAVFLSGRKILTDVFQFVRTLYSIAGYVLPNCRKHVLPGKLQIFPNITLTVSVFYDVNRLFLHLYLFAAILL